MVVRQIIGSLEEIGKDVAKQTASVPKDVAGKALESLGAGKTGKGQVNPTPQPGTEAKTEEANPLEKVEETKDEKAKRAVARAALEYLAKKQQAKEPGVRERLEKEKEQQRQLEKKQEEEAKKMELPKIMPRRRRGDFYGLSAKQGAAEKSRNIRQD